MAYKDGYSGGYGQELPLTLFTAPLYNEKWGDERSSRHRQWSLWRYYEPVVQTVQTVIIVDSVVIPTASEGTATLTAAQIASADEGSGEGGKSVFRGKLNHTVNSTEATLLAAAGYTVA